MFIDRLRRQETLMKVNGKIITVLVLSLVGTLFSIENSSVQKTVQHCKISDSVKLNVVYIPQNDDKSCATTCVAMVISYYEKLKCKPLDKEIVWKISGTDERAVSKDGNDMKGLTRIADHYGYKSEYCEHMQIDDLEHLLAKGIPVILNIKASQRGLATHAVLVIGYDKNKKIFYINDPVDRKKKILKYSDLESRWMAHLSSPYGMSYQSGFVVYPKNHK